MKVSLPEEVIFLEGEYIISYYPVMSYVEF